MSDNYNDIFSNDPLNDSDDTSDVEKENNDSVDSVDNSGEYHYKGTGEKEDIFSSSSYRSPYSSQPSYGSPSQQNAPYYGTQYGSNYSDSQSAPQYGSQYGAKPENTQYGAQPRYSQYSSYSQPYQQPYTAQAENEPYRAPHHNPYTPDDKKNTGDKNNKGKGFIAIMLVVCILVSSFLGFAGAMVYTNLSSSGSSASEAMVINKVDIDEKTAQNLADKPTSQIADEVADTVVEITTEIMSTNSFYGQYVSQGAGSGVIISADGYIVTNNHVIDGASSITVTLRDQTTYDAQLIGKDSVIDVALLKVDATGLKAATFGDSDNLKVGDKAVAIGNPLGQLGGTVTDGIISALDRDVVIDGETMNLLQTDTAINPGNSGGGLFDGQGALVGVVVAKSSGEEIEGLGFAIPINDVVDIIDDLKEFGYVRGRVSMGVELIDLTNTMYAMYYYGNDEAGCYVYSVVPDSAAYNAGIQKGDRIVSIDSKVVTTTADVVAALDDKNVSDVVKVELERGSRTATIEIALDEYIPEDVARSQQNSNDYNNPFS